MGRFVIPTKTRDEMPEGTIDMVGAGRILGISRSYVQRLVSIGELPMPDAMYGRTYGWRRDRITPYAGKVGVRGRGWRNGQRTPKPAPSTLRNRAAVPAKSPEMIAPADVRALLRPLDESPGRSRQYRGWW